MNPNLRGQYAGFVTRLAAYGIDVAIVVVAVAASVWLVNSSFDLIGINVSECRPLTLPFELENTVCNLTRLGMALYAVAFAPVYWIFFWTAGGQSPGMAIMGVRVLRTNGKPMTLWRSFLRVVGLGVCFLTLGLGFLLILVNDERRGLQDMIAGTCVIYAWRGEQNVTILGKAQNWLRRRGRNKATPAS